MSDVSITLGGSAITLELISGVPAVPQPGSYPVSIELNPGTPGDPGVVVGPTAPTDHTKIWIDTSP